MVRDLVEMVWEIVADVRVCDPRAKPRVRGAPQASANEGSSIDSVNRSTPRDHSAKFCSNPRSLGLGPPR